MIGEASAAFDDLRFQGEPIHVHHGREEFGQRVGIVLHAGAVGVQVDVGAGLGVPGDHVEIEHTEDVLLRIRHVAGVVVAAVHPLLLAREEYDADGTLEIQDRQQVGCCHQRGGAAAVVVGARGRVVGPVRRPGVEVSGEEEDLVRIHEPALLADDVAQRVAPQRVVVIAHVVAQRLQVLVHVLGGLGDGLVAVGVPGGQAVRLAADENRPLPAEPSDVPGEGVRRDPAEQVGDQRVVYGRGGNVAGDARLKHDWIGAQARYAHIQLLHGLQRHAPTLPSHSLAAIVVDDGQGRGDPLSQTRLTALDQVVDRPRGVGVEHGQRQVQRAQPVLLARGEHGQQVVGAWRGQVGLYRQIQGGHPGQILGSTQVHANQGGRVYGLGQARRGQHQEHKPQSEQHGKQACAHFSSSCRWLSSIVGVAFRPERA